MRLANRTKDFKSFDRLIASCFEHLNHGREIWIRDGEMFLKFEVDPVHHKSLVQNVIYEILLDPRGGNGPHYRELLANQDQFEPAGHLFKEFMFCGRFEEYDFGCLSPRPNLFEGLIQPLYGSDALCLGPAKEFGQKLLGYSILYFESLYSRGLINRKYFRVVDAMLDVSRLYGRTDLSSRFSSIGLAISEDDWVMRKHFEAKGEGGANSALNVSSIYCTSIERVQILEQKWASAIKSAAPMPLSFDFHKSTRQRAKA